MVSSFVASASILALGVLTGVLLARTLGPSGRGELAAVVLWPLLLLSIGNLGVNEAVTFHAARHTSSRPTLLSTSIGLAVCQGITLIVIGLVLVPLVLSGHEESSVHASLLFLAVIPIGLVNLYLISLLNGFHRFGWFNLLRVSAIATSAVGLAGLMIADELTVTTAVLAYLGGAMITALAVTMVALPLSGGTGPFSGGLARDVLSFGWRSQLSTVSSTLNERLDQLVISIFLSATSLGLYVVAWTMTSLTNLIGTSVALVALPAAASADSPAAQRGAARRYVGLTFCASLAVTAPLLLFTPSLIKAAFGPEFRGATDSAQILVVAGMILATSRALQGVLKGTNRPLDASIAEGVGLAVTAPGLAILLPTLGILGAALTSTLAYSASVIVGLRYANQALHTRGIELLFPGK